jgi:hypothetical protein
VELINSTAGEGQVQDITNTHNLSDWLGASQVCQLNYSKRQTGALVRTEGRGQKLYYWYVVVSAVRSVLTFMATVILGMNHQILPIAVVFTITSQKIAP